jgi:methyl-accepting chemotaxis protein WspA
MSIENFSRQLNQYVDDVRKIASQQAQIIHHVQELTPQFERVHSVMQSQAAGAGQITDAMIELNGMAQKSVEALKHSTLAVEQLNAAARGLQKEVSHFIVQN